MNPSSIIRSTTLAVPQDVPPIAVTVRLRNSGCFQSDYQKALDELATIILIHSPDEWKDPLSARLFRWAANALNFPRNGILDERMIEKAHKKIVKLAHRILVNPLDKAPLKDPVLAQAGTLETSSCIPALAKERIWERWMLEHYLELHVKFKPIKAVEIRLMPHEFAQKMLLWVKSLILDLNQLRLTSETQNSSDTSLATSGGSNKRYLDSSIITKGSFGVEELMAFFTYEKLIENADDQEHIRQLRRQYERSIQYSEEMLKTFEDTLREERERIEENFRLHRDEVNHRMEHIEIVHKNTTNILHDRVNDLSGRLGVSEENCRKFAQQCKSLSIEVQNLRHAYEQKVQEVNNLRNESDDSFCIIA